MADPRGEPAPLTLLTGFLGAGKTTLLNRMIAASDGLRLGILVNDFGDVDIDGELVVGVEDDVISLANGCVCCQIRDDLVGAVDRVLARQPRPEHLVLEASGVSDPMSLIATFADPGMASQIDLDGVIAVVDADQFLSDASLLELKLRQVVCADLVVLNKSDLAGPPGVEAVEEWIAGRARRIRIIPTSEADVPLEILLGARQDRPEVRPEPLDAHSHGFATSTFVSEAPLSLARLEDAVRSLPGWVYRAKGLVRSVERPGERTVLQLVGRRLRLSHDGWGDSPHETRIVVIGRSDLYDPAVIESELGNCVVDEPAAIPR